MNSNIVYKSDELLEFYRSNRHAWEEFYPSEQWVFNRIANKKDGLGKVLDVGCAGGGLAKALEQRFTLSSYTGADIHAGIIDWATKNQKCSFPLRFIQGDITDLALDSDFDLVISLSCADWNIETLNIIQSCWQRVKPGGHFVISLRLTDGPTINDMQKSYQNIDFFGDAKAPEKANYVVINYREAVDMMRHLTVSPSLIGAYGYWGEPSKTATTPFERILFSVFYVQKKSADQDQAHLEFNWPKDISTKEI